MKSSVFSYFSKTVLIKNFNPILINKHFARRQIPENNVKEFQEETIKALKITMQINEHAVERELLMH